VNEQQVISYIRYNLKKDGKNVTQAAVECGYRANTFYSWFAMKTRITLDGLTVILDMFDQVPAVMDSNGVFHFDILTWLGTEVRKNKKAISKYHKDPEYVRGNIRLWATHKHGLKLCALLEILDVFGAELMILRKSKKR